MEYGILCLDPFFQLLTINKDVDVPEYNELAEDSLIPRQV